ncbi:transcriptional regulator family: Fungal Specific TF [Penicillium hispanicum]|uniref:transcriptional regulator family: Fungal Specific TF n=1 Tax=Penicillium hispanicum TaxID=1080232 RepID=UPI002540F5BF|nr:transcriptional regulator family: Fungal Specific TF [Penicillium hispanicum]KAJ5578568.1 transcriptional regulator family: Fungal Specific TF [Penicillium hispanicum]
MTPFKKPSGRIGSTKSKTGCDTCKSVFIYPQLQFHGTNYLQPRARRIRCGEEKPHCVKCTSTGRQCSYASLKPSPEIVGSPQSQITREFSHLAARERRAFEYYFHQAGPSLSGVLDLSFWRGSVLQICRLEPAVWDAIISLSALYERPPIHGSAPFALINGPAAVRHAYHHEALVWYSRSLTALQKRINQGVADLTVSLITCILFIAIELLQGNRNAALTLYRQGAQMMVSAMASVGGPSDHKTCINRGFLVSAVKPIFRRLGTWVLINNGIMEDSRGLDLIILDEHFTSMDDARNVLCGIVAEMKTLNLATRAHWKKPTDTRRREAFALVARQGQLENRLHHWHRLFKTSKFRTISHPQPVAGSDTGETALLYMTYISVLIETRTCLNTDQAAYDDYELEFAQILDCASTAIAATRNSDGKQPPFLFEMGVFLPLFVAALKCRSPQLRRQALRYMWDAPPAQGLFMCDPAAYVVALIVILEEDPTSVLQEGSDVWEALAKPGCRPAPRDRIWDFRVSSQASQDGTMQGWLHYTLRNWDCEDGEIQFVERSLPFPS